MNATRFLLLTTVVLSPLVAPGDAAARIVSVGWTARAATVVGSPFGLSVPLQTPVSGYFTFDTSAPDKNVSASEGEYPQTKSGFLASFLGTAVHGSHTAFYQVDLVAGDPTLDTFRIYDGPRDVGFEGGVMSLGDTPDADIELLVAVAEDVFDSDGLLDPFPLYHFGFLGTPHTFTLGDDRGTMLLQFESAVELGCGDGNANGSVTAADALEVLRAAVGATSCYPCVCDVDQSGGIAASDALKTLRRAVGGSALVCSTCS